MYLSSIYLVGMYMDMVWLHIEYILKWGQVFNQNPFNVVLVIVNDVIDSRKKIPATKYLSGRTIPWIDVKMRGDM